MDDNGFLELDSNGELVRLEESLQGPPSLDRTTSAAREVLDLASLASPPSPPWGAEKSEKADGQQQEESEEESLFVAENEKDNKQSVDDATEEPSRKRRRSSPGSPEAAKKAKINYEDPESTTSANSNDDDAAVDDDTVNENQESLMTTEKADEVIDALDSQFEGRLLQMGWPMAPLKTTSDEKRNHWVDLRSPPKEMAGPMTIPAPKSSRNTHSSPLSRLPCIVTFRLSHDAA
ncbi:hypothetical protein G7054_g4270 [Neopestalotiopsis clavispora]|nr:hypothetical protein G7054_g4270 [Neopestalotiopsis clavispora]